MESAYQLCHIAAKMYWNVFFMEFGTMPMNHAGPGCICARACVCRPMILSPASVSLKSSSQASTVSIEPADVTDHRQLVFAPHSFTIRLLVDNREIFGQG